MEPEDTLLSSQVPAGGANHEPEHPNFDVLMTVYLSIFISLFNQLDT